MSDRYGTSTINGSSVPNSMAHVELSKNKITMKLNRKKNSNELELGRRDFLRLGSLGTVLGVAGLASIPKKVAANSLNKEVRNRISSTEDHFPLEVNDSYQAPRSWDHVHAQAFFGGPLEAAGQKVDAEVKVLGSKFRSGGDHPTRKGFGPLEKALAGGAWALSGTTVGSSVLGIHDYGLFSWEQEDANRTSPGHEFQSAKEASAAIKRAAKLYGADLVGITHQDSRWDYREFFSPIAPAKRKMFPSMSAFKSLVNKNWAPDQFTHGWEKFPFKAKSVIVLAFEMDYEAISASSTEVSAAAVGEGYSRMAKTAYQLAVFLKSLGYGAVAAGNDLGVSVPYAIAAGLGEASRMGQLVTYKYGPRVRIAKVYTDFDFVEYDKAKSFGVMDFCRNCKRCADACPGKAITHDTEPSFYPTHEDKENPWYNAVGVKKYYMNAKNCFKVWADAGSDCTNCIASCPYNKPDFWHHRLVDGISAVMPGTVHDFMREMDILFGYGNVDDGEAVDKFFSTRNRSYDGF